MLKKLMGVSVFSALALTCATAAFSQGAVPNMAGTYKCEGSAETCKASGTTLTVTQTGNELAVKNETGAIGSGHVTSPITVSMGPPWNMMGVVHQANVIEFSNGTSWKKQ